MTSGLMAFYLLGSSMHASTLMTLLVIRVFETHDGHSGYEFPWSPFRLIPFGAGATYHDFHHSKNVGNYGSFMTVWDTIFNTNKDYYAAEIAQKEKNLEKMKSE